MDKSHNIINDCLHLSTDGAGIVGAVEELHASGIISTEEATDALLLMNKWVEEIPRAEMQRLVAAYFITLAQYEEKNAGPVNSGNQAPKKKGPPVLTIVK